MKKYISMIVASMMAVSCVDTIILPDNMTVEEDFWQSKSDVQLMVSGAYQSMLSSDIQTRLLVWSGLRSDELIPVANLNGSLPEDLTEVNLANIQEDNVFAEWAAFYKVINNCNIVLEKAGRVLENDPSYTQGDYLADCSKMLALRSLCYFYLVRNYRDVPFYDYAFNSSSQENSLPQTAPATVLEHLITDLQTAETNAVAGNAFGNWQDVGFFTRDGIQALLADIYLWRGSVMHNASDYQKCVEYCDKVIASKKLNHRVSANRYRTEDPADPYPSLSQGNETFTDLYVTQNAEESIFELQYNGVNNGNVALCQYYNHYSGTNAPYLYASEIYAYGGSVYTSNNGLGDITTDWRGQMNSYNEVSDVGDFRGLQIRKYVSDSPNFLPSTSSVATEAKNRAYSANYQQNFIVYRLADVMLMKAEALTAQATGDYTDDSNVAAAFDLVRIVNARSLENPDDSMTIANVKPDASKMEILVLQERQRELAFEGKRWYDLLRYNYRHINGVDYNKILADQTGTAFVANYQPMLDLIKQKLSGKGDAVTNKLRTEPTLYMPIPLKDLKICPQLKQNPNYSSSETTSKNY